MNTTRRHFLQNAGALGAALAALPRLGSAHPIGPLLGEPAPGKLGPLVADPQGFCDLPAGFAYTTFSRAGEAMDDGFFVPALHDGMAAFPGPDGLTRLVRNHENLVGGSGGPFGEGHALLAKVEPGRAFDRGYEKAPCLGGTTTLTFDTAKGELVEHHLSLAATARNCAGGPTPWGSWLTCEEYTGRAGETHEVDHGWVFEVPADAPGLVPAEPLRAMGRFNHEATATDPRTGVVYLTEDQDDSLFYRFLPDVPGELAKGGKLQALAVRGAPSLDTRNWTDFTRVPTGEEFETMWVNLEDVESPDDTLRHEGFVAGAARFARGEGMAFDGESVWFTCTSGGKQRAGQVWRYVPSPDEGGRGERRERGTLALFFESAHRRLVDMCDNLTVTPWGDLLLCEDGPGTNSLVLLTPKGDVIELARNAISEFAGACFSPDGSTLFVNIQGASTTLAITGPWPE